MAHINNDHCLVCKTPLNGVYLDLGDQPLANSYHRGEALPKYPLAMKHCANCGHSQLSVSVDPAEMFAHYLYVSDTSVTLTKYFEWTTDYILKNAGNSSSVLEIACNSGLLLEMFQKRGLRSVGVDPAANLRELSQQRNLNVYVDYWNTAFANTLRDKEGRFDLVLAFHVLPHVPDPNDFIESCLSVLAPGGRVYIQTSQCDMFLNNEFDVIYHEHSSYFTGKSILELAQRHGLYVSSIIKTDIHGRSFLFSLQREACDQSQLMTLIQDQTQQGVYTAAKYAEFAARAAQTKQDLTAILDQARADGYTLIGYGAAAKGNTLLNYMNYKLDYIIDDNPMKVGYLTPGMDIEIVSIDILKQPFERVCFIPLAWNFYYEIKERIARVRNNGNDMFIRYFPEIRIDKND